MSLCLCKSCFCAEWNWAPLEAWTEAAPPFEKWLAGVKQAKKGRMDVMEEATTDDKQNAENCPKIQIIIFVRSSLLGRVLTWSTSHQFQCAMCCLCIQIQQQHFSVGISSSVLAPFISHFENSRQLHSIVIRITRKVGHRTWWQTATDGFLHSDAANCYLVPNVVNVVCMLLASSLPVNLWNVHAPLPFITRHTDSGA